MKWPRRDFADGAISSSDSSCRYWHRTALRAASQKQSNGGTRFAGHVDYARQSWDLGVGLFPRGPYLRTPLDEAANSTPTSRLYACLAGPSDGVPTCSHASALPSSASLYHALCSSVEMTLPTPIAAISVITDTVTKDDITHLPSRKAGPVGVPSH